MARSRAVCATLAAALLGSAAWGWWVGGRATATFTADVVDVVDGDTIVAQLAPGRTETVRLLGVDTPETVHPERGVECFGPEASAYAEQRLAGRRVTLQRDTELRDAYGRMLAYVVVDGARVNDELLRLGYARFLVLAPNGRHARALLAAELTARREQRGLWAACGR